VSGYPSAGDDDLTTDFLSKPFSREDLLAKVREVLDRP
jgi:DNA-binding response OmpR family regulator